MQSGTISPEGREKIRVIEVINRQLIDHQQLPLNPKDFDVLYDLDIDSLVSAKHEIESQLEQLRRIKQFSV